MPWLRVDDKFHDSAKVDGLSDVAFRVWSMAACWCRKLENLHLDGFVPSAALQTITKRRWSTEAVTEAVTELVEATVGGLHAFGLWEVREGGWRFHDWEHYQPNEPMSIRDAARLGGLKSAESRRLKHGTATPKNARNNRTETEPVRATDTEALHVPVRATDTEPTEPPSPIPIPIPIREEIPLTPKRTKRTASATKPETELPEDWKPTDNHKAFAAAHGLDIEVEVVGFRGHYDGKTAVSWNGRFATWLAQSVKFSKPRGLDGKQAALFQTGTHLRPDVQRLHDAWRRAIGRHGAVLRPDDRTDATALAGAIDAHGLDDCLLVASSASSDPWVSGRADDHKTRHDSVAYIFGKEETFSRILTAAKLKVPVANGGVKKSGTDIYNELESAGRF